MPDKPFLDTNIIVYAFSADDPRNEKAYALLEAGGVISVQVLNELVNVWRRAGCSILYSEDLQHQQAIKRLTIRNPFAQS